MEESGVFSGFGIRNLLDREISWPVLLLTHMLVLLVHLCFSIQFFGNGLLYLQLSLILSSLLWFTYQHYKNRQDEIRLSGWSIILFVLLGVSLILYPFMDIINAGELGYVIIASVIFCGNVLWFVPRIKHLVLSNGCDPGHLLATICTSMVLLLILCLTRLFVINLSPLEGPFFLEVGLYCSLIILLYVSLQLMIHYLRGTNGEPHLSNVGDFQTDHLAMRQDTSGLSVMAAHEIRSAVRILEHEFEQNKMYLHNTFCLDMLSDKTGFSKSKLTYVFNNYYKKGFYRIVGEYRIRYAMKILDDDQNLSLEALSEQCGFNSKSSFYKYFKMLNGCTPQQYLLLRTEVDNTADS